MKRRILSVVLALCLCISSQAVVCAGQGGETQGTAAGESTAEPESSGETDTAPPELPALSEDEPETDETATQPEGSEEPATDETAEEPETSDEEDTALQEISLLQETVLMERAIYQPGIPTNPDLTRDGVYNAMMALKDKEGYKEGTDWTNTVPYSGEGEDVYRWKGGTIDGKNIVSVGCVAFAFSLSDAAFGTLPARMYSTGEFQFEDIKVGDILRVNNDAHTVIVIEVNDAGVIVAEGNISIGDHKGKVHWGRAISKEEVRNNTSHYITRYPSDYVPSDDPEANILIAHGSLDGGLSWNLTKAGTLTISGNGTMLDFSSAEDQPWKANRDTIRKVVIGQGVTSIGSCAFWNCGVLSAEIPSSVKTIGDSAFNGSSLLSVTIPSSVKTIGDSAFQNCKNLSSVTISEGVETIGQNAFNYCTSLASISLPASIGEVGAAAFFQCTAMKSVVFASGSKQVKMGDDIFGGCWYLMNVTLPSNMDCIGARMFHGCTMLPGVEIPQGVTSIGASAFASCSGFTTVVIPDSVTTIGIAAFGNCPMKDIYFTGAESQWNSINIIGDKSTIINATMHYNYIPTTKPDPDESGDNNDNTGDNSGDNQGGDKPGNPSDENKPGESKPDENKSGESELSVNNSDEDSQDIKAAVDTWKPTTPDEIKQYAYVGKEPVRCILPVETAYLVDMENSVQGPMCIQVFESVRGDYTIGRTYNIYAVSENTYTTDQKVQITIQIPQSIYKNDREYKMICVTEGGLPVVYDDLDSDPKTITIETNTFHAYALIYK